jgi:hypothetical protein
MSNRVYPDPAMQSLLTAARRYSNSTNGNEAPPTTTNGGSRAIPIHRQDHLKYVNNTGRFFLLYNIYLKRSLILLDSTAEITAHIVSKASIKGLNEYCTRSRKV